MPSPLDTALGDYLKEIKKFPLLTAEEERELGSKIQAAASSDALLANREITLAQHERMQVDAAEARNRMISGNLRLVISVAKNFRNRGLPMEDLVEEGNVGLVNAVDRYDPSVGSRFSTYASYWIDQAIRRAVQNATQMIHIPSYLMEQIGAMKIALRTLEEELGRPPSMQELAVRMEISPRKAAAISQAIQACTCPNQATAGEDGSSIAESLPDHRTPAPHDRVFSESDERFVQTMLSLITDREAKVLELRYGLNGNNGKQLTLKEIGKKIGKTRERVRQIEREAIGKLAEYLKSHLETV